MGAVSTNDGARNGARAHRDSEAGQHCLLPKFALKDMADNTRQNERGADKNASGARSLDIGAKDKNHNRNKELSASHAKEAANRPNDKTCPKRSGNIRDWVL